jgi:hypothetical protein
MPLNIVDNISYRKHLYPPKCNIKKFVNMFAFTIWLWLSLFIDFAYLYQNNYYTQSYSTISYQELNTQNPFIRFYEESRQENPFRNGDHLISTNYNINNDLYTDDIVFNRNTRAVCKNKICQDGIFKWHESKTKNLYVGGNLIKIWFI